MQRQNTADTLGGVVKGNRKAKNLTREQLAQILDVSPRQRGESGQPGEAYLECFLATGFAFLALFLGVGLRPCVCLAFVGFGAGFAFFLGLGAALGGAGFRFGFGISSMAAWSSFFWWLAASS